MSLSSHAVPVHLGSSPTGFGIPARDLDADAISALWASPLHQAAKRAIDFVGAGFGLLCLLPLMLLVATLIRLGSKGPAVFRQTRLGKDGNPFTLYKFRTMVQDAEDRLSAIEHLNESDGGVLFKIKRDPRITPLGRVLRRSSLDELPQLFNVLCGEMSLVGPRPLQLRDCQLLAEADSRAYAQRLEVRPGLTGFWQVHGRSETGFAHMLQMDLTYLQEWSLWVDLRIMLQTVFIVLHGQGAC